MIWKPFFDAQGRASWPHGGIENVIISAYWSIQIFTQYGHVIRINMYYVHINIYIYICVLQRSCMHESRPTGAFGFILGLKVTSVASSLGLPWGKGRGSWRPGDLRALRQRRRRKAKKKEPPHKGAQNLSPCPPRLEPGRVSFWGENGRIGGKSYTWFGPWRHLAERQLWKRHDGQKGGQDKAIILLKEWDDFVSGMLKASNLPALDACYQC